MIYSQNRTRVRRLPALLCVGASLAALIGATAQAAVPGITGTSFSLVATDAYTTQPDGASIYSWGYGCSATVTPTFAPAGSTGTCPTMQIPGPTLVVTQGQPVTITLTDQLPSAAGNTSIVFPGFNVTASGGAAGIVAQEATPSSPVTYTFTPTNPGTYAYYSGTQSELQIEMGLFGAIIVLPSSPPSGAGCHALGTFLPDEVANAKVTGKPAAEYRLSSAAYNNPQACYDREYLFQFSEINLAVHQTVDAQKTGAPGSLNVTMDPYQPQYFLINGRSMPDDMDAPYAPSYLHQPYNGNPHMHPGDLMLMRIIEQGRMQHPFHFHGNHARVLARDANMLLNADGVSLAGPLLFTTATVPGQTQDQIFAWTGQGLNWDVYGRTQGHTCNGIPLAQAISNVATPVAATTAQLAGKGGGYSSPFDPTTKEWCPDHGKDMPVAPPDPQTVANGLWYGGTPYLGLQSVNPTPLPPSAVIQNPDAGYAYMWHSHNEREITTNNVFPGGMMMMLIIDPPTAPINELQ